MKRKPVKKHPRKHAHPHELVFVLVLALMVSLLGLYAYSQMFTFRVAAAAHP